jgi:hypothetical protein
MGTRGYYGFRYKKKYYMIYNHFDSYFSYLGKHLLDEIKEMINNDEFDVWLETFLALKIVTENDKPTDEDIEKCMKYYDDSVGNGRPDNYYSLLRKCQGSYKQVFESGYALIHPDATFANDLWIEYAYMLDLDKKQFHIVHNKVTKIYNFDELKNVNEFKESDFGVDSDED